MLYSCAFRITLVAFLALSAAAQSPTRGYPKATQAQSAPVGTEEPCISHSCLFYAGDYDVKGQSPNGLWNGYNAVYSPAVMGEIYVPFTVPRRYKGTGGKTDWIVDGLFANVAMDDPYGVGIVVTSVNWSIVQGVTLNAVPANLTTICAGSGKPIVTATGRTDQFGDNEYTIMVLGLGCPNLEAGTYWMTVLPSTEDLPYLDDVEDNTPANAQGPGTEPADLSFWFSPYFGYTTLQPTAGAGGACGGAGTGCDRFSVGVIGRAVR